MDVHKRNSEAKMNKVVEWQTRIPFERNGISSVRMMSCQFSCASSADAYRFTVLHA